MTKLLINIGLIAVCFFIFPGLDVRDVKMTVAVNMALALCLSGLYEGYVKPVKNKWLYIFLGFSLLSYIVAPNPTLSLMGINVGYFWIWQPMYHYLVFGLALIVITSIPYTLKELQVMLNIAIWCGFIMALYVILQRFNIDQLFDNVGTDNLGRMAGTVGNPTHVSPFMGMLIPIAFYLRRYFFAVIMLTAIYLTHSQVAIGATIIGMLAYLGFKNLKVMVSIAGVCLLLIFALAIILKTDLLSMKQLSQRFDGHQRCMVYHQIIKDVNEKPFKDSGARYPLSGWGMGNFKYTFRFAHIEDETFKRFVQAHNDYLEVLYNTGIVGLVLFIMTLFVLFRDKFRKFYFQSLGRMERALLSGFIVICAAACFTFVWQVGTTAYFSIVFAGLLYNSEANNA